MLILDLRKKTLWFGAIIVLLIIAGILFFNAFQGRRLISMAAKSLRLLPVYRVNTTLPQVALSFDASWGAEHTEEILNILDRYQIKSTFFLVNVWIEDYPELSREISSRGHEIGLHSASHSNFSKLSPAQMEKELRDNFSLIKEITGQQGVLFRPPFGDYNNQVIKTASALGFQPVQWSVDSLDWKDISAAEIVERVLRNISVGDIVLLHNNGKHTAEALTTILETLKSKGLEAVPIGTLLLKDNWYIDYNGVQRAN
jgi:polysaccharide deacetylase family sporulation protein PdaB